MHLVFHFHRFHNQHQVILFHDLALCDRHSDNFAGHRGGDITRRFGFGPARSFGSSGFGGFGGAGQDLDQWLQMHFFQAVVDLDVVRLGAIRFSAGP